LRELVELLDAAMEVVADRPAPPLAATSGLPPGPPYDRSDNRGPGFR